MFSARYKTLNLALWPLLFVLMLVPFSAQFDMAIERYFFKDGFTNKSFDWLFQYGPWLANLTASAAVFILIGTYFNKAWERLRKPAFVVAMTLLIGSLFIVHGVFKDHWGRPRPKQVVEFGGAQEFRSFYQPNFFNQPEPSKSFPCGHCSTGYFFLVFGLLGIRYNIRWLTIFGFAFGLFFGTLLGYMRMLQGGHFLTDVLFAGLIMWWTALILDRVVYGRRRD